MKPAMVDEETHENCQDISLLCWINTILCSGRVVNLEFEDGNTLYMYPVKPRIKGTIHLKIQDASVSRRIIKRICYNDLLNKEGEIND